MFDIFVYLYETYYRPESCPDSIVLAKKLSAIGFDDEEIVEALDWLNTLANINGRSNPNELIEISTGFRVYTEQEQAQLGPRAIGFIEYLCGAKLLNTQQREIVFERAMAIDESPIALEKLKIIILMLLWSQGREPDMLLFDELLLDEEDQAGRLLH